MKPGQNAIFVKHTKRFKNWEVTFFPSLFITKQPVTSALLTLNIPLDKRKLLLQFLMGINQTQVSTLLMMTSTLS